MFKDYPITLEVFLPATTGSFVPNSLMPADANLRTGIAGGKIVVIFVVSEWCSTARAIQGLYPLVNCTENTQTNMTRADLVWPDQAACALPGHSIHTTCYITACYQKYCCQGVPLKTCCYDKTVLPVKLCCAMTAHCKVLRLLCKIES